MKRAIIGTVGVPGRYGGFETLAENLVQYHHTKAERLGPLSVYCSASAYPEQTARYMSTDLHYSRFKANGVQSIPYDIVTGLDALRRGHKVLLFLGVSGAVVLPVIRLVSRARIVTNVDGIEWKREKWTGAAKWFLKFSEKLAVRFSHEVIADNQAIADYLQSSYGVTADVIAYGGDHAVAPTDGKVNTAVLDALPDSYALALCRIEPENNVAMILEAYAKSGEPLVFVGNWANSDFGRKMRDDYADVDNLHLTDPVYDPATLQAVRRRASAYVHGHSAGGTNPSLVEMMHFGIPVFAFDCVFNRYTTEQKALYFATADELAEMSKTQDAPALSTVATAMQEIAQREYTWDHISQRYFELMA